MDVTEEEADGMAWTPRTWNERWQGVSGPRERHVRELRFPLQSRENESIDIISISYSDVK